MLKMRYMALLSAASVMALSQSATFADIITNGGFESSSASYYKTGLQDSWTFGQYSGVLAGTPASPQGDFGTSTDFGAQFAIIQKYVDGSHGSISQSITLPAAGTYELDFSDASRDGNATTYDVMLGSTVIASLTSHTSPEISTSTAQVVSFSSLVTTPQTLTFVTTGDNIDRSVFLDNISITQTPEPASLGLLGLAGAGLLARRRRM